MSNNKILWGSDKNAIIYLVGINFVIYFFLRALFIIFQNDPETHLQDYNGVVNQFVLPGNANSFLFKIWTLFSYFFTHISFMSMLSNMVWLFSFSYLLQIVAGNRYLFPSYLYGGLIGGVVFIITNAITQQNGVMMGATTSILSIAATTIAVNPNYKIFPFINGGTPIWILFVLFIVITVLATYQNNIYYLPSYAAATAMGYLYGKSILKGNDWGNWMHWIYNEVLGNNNPPKSFKVNKSYNENGRVPFTKEKIVNQKNIDEVLDKINSTGVESLTEEEQFILQKAKDQL